jgi:phosphatidylglycerol:prolipoprotein diacylglycerol transferase
MHPWLFNVPPISTYGACIVCGLILAWLLARRTAKSAGVDPSLIDLLIPLVVGAGLAGSYAFGWWTDALTDEATHGFVLVGAMIFATVMGIAYALIASLPLGVLGDIFAAPAALGIACGRVGCFFAGCCYGKISTFNLFPFCIRFPRGSFAFSEQVRAGLIPAAADASLPIYPVQLYEAALCALLAWVLASRLGPPKIPGERFLLLGIGYGLIRFPLEFLRADNPPAVGGLTFSQAASIAVGIAAVVTWVVRRRCAGSLNLVVPDRAVASY